MRDERAQMMLLTAVILLIGFVALAGMVARVSQLPEETVRESRDPVLAQIENVQDGLSAALVRADDFTPLATEPEEHKVLLEEAVAFLEQTLAARGYSSQFTVDCQLVGSDTEVSIEAQMARGGVAAEFSVSAVYTGASCWL